ncbi:MAG: TetR/AcrR family transcriptional regulator [Lachnospiraceae bacterium]
MPYHHGNLRTALIEEGIKIVNEVGVGGCSLRKVAAACGVSRGAPYAHFKDKEDMLEAMKQYVTEKFAAILNNAVADCTDSSKLLIETGKAYLHFFIENPNYYPFLFNQSNLQIVLTENDEKAEDYRQFENDKNAFVVIMDELDVPESLQMQNMIALWAMVHGLAGIVTMKGVEFDGDWDDMIEKVLSENLILVR